MNKKQLIVAWVMVLAISCIFLYIQQRLFWNRPPATEGLSLEFIKEVDKMLYKHMTIFAVTSLIPVLIVGGLLMYTSRGKKK